MARGFTEDERRTIRSDLIKAGRKLFGTYGLRKTSIGDLTGAVGIAQGSFYTFFDSKDELYLEVVHQEFEMIRCKFINSDLLNEKLNREKFKALFRKAIKIITSNPIIKRIFLEDEFELLVKRMSPLKIKEKREQVLKDLIPLIKKCQRDGTMVDKPAEVIAQVLQYASFPIIHKHDIDEHIYQETIELYLDILAKGLIVEENEL